MCLHNDTIDDYSTGDVVCLICGLVLDKLFLSRESNNQSFVNLTKDEPFNKTNRENNLHESVSDFLTRTNIHASYLDDILKNVKQLLLRFSHFPISLIIASACFVSLAKTEHPVALTKFESMVCESKRDKKNLFKMIVSIHEPSIYPNLSVHVANGMLQGLPLSYSDVESIKKNIKELKCEFCTYSPMTVIASHTLLYIKSKNQSTSLSEICLHIGVSKTSVYSFINKQRHICVKSWDNVYKQLSYR